MIAVLAFLLPFVDGMADTPGPHGVRLRDAWEFGVHPACVEGLWRQASGHSTLMRERMQTENHPDVVAAWQRDCDWRAKVWDQLDNVLRCPLPAESKRKCLVRLRELLGEDDYESRTLPCPVPTYTRIR